MSHVRHGPTGRKTDSVGQPWGRKTRAIACRATNSQGRWQGRETEQGEGRAQLRGMASTVFHLLPSTATDGMLTPGVFPALPTFGFRTSLIPPPSVRTATAFAPGTPPASSTASAAPPDPATSSCLRFCPPSAAAAPASPADSAPAAGGGGGSSAGPKSGSWRLLVLVS